jgi:VIT1/CCC1 family predicted Fe2+/Mn2+ transporter
VPSHELILVAGFSGVVAGAISMTIGAYTSSRSEIEHYQCEIEKGKARNRRGSAD